MKKRGLRIIAIFFMLVLILNTLTACGEKEEEKSTRQRRSDKTETEENTDIPTENITEIPTEEITPEPADITTQAPTEEPTAEPTEEPTFAPTEEPTPEPTEEPTAIPTEEITPAPGDGTELSKVELKCENGSFSILVPEGCETTVYDNRMYAMSEGWCIEAIYLDSMFSGAVYDIDDLKAMLAESDDAECELLYAAVYEKYGAPELVMINGTKCLLGPASDMVMYNNESNTPIYSRYVAYDCKYDTGIILADVVFYDKEYATLDAETKALEKELMSCLESVEQYSSPSEFPGVRYTVTLPNGSDFEFISVEGAVNRVEDDENTNGVDVYFNEGTAESIYIGKYKKCDDYSTPAEYLEFKKKSTGEEQFHYSDPVDINGRMTYNYWELTYHLAGDDYIEKVYVTEKGDYLYIVFLYRYDYAMFEDDGEGLLSDIIWSLREL